MCTQCTHSDPIAASPRHGANERNWARWDSAARSAEPRAWWVEPTPDDRVVQGCGGSPLQLVQAVRQWTWATCHVPLKRLSQTGDIWWHDVTCADIWCPDLPECSRNLNKYEGNRRKLTFWAKVGGKEWKKLLICLQGSDSGTNRSPFQQGTEVSCHRRKFRWPWISEQDLLA
jgi:hypothetical protein